MATPIVTRKSNPFDPELPLLSPSVVVFCSLMSLSRLYIIFMKQAKKYPKRYESHHHVGSTTQTLINGAGLHRLILTSVKINLSGVIYKSMRQPTKLCLILLWRLG